jgi:hypothetical protein
MPRLNREELRRASEKAKKLDVEVKPAKNPKKKLDVFKDGKRVASIGSSEHSDWLQHKDPERRKRYKQRHEKYRHRKGTASYYADQILW